MSDPAVLDAALLIGIPGVLLLAAALFGDRIKRLPVSTSMLYLLVGLAVGPLLARRLDWDFASLAPVLERVTEFAILVSLFIAGLKLGLPANSGRWRLPLRLASVSMLVTVALVAPLAVFLLDLPWGAGILLGAILAPTDPVLATEVQVKDNRDHDQLRVNLTGEAALNDGSAFPFVMLGLGLLGLHDIGEHGVRWLLVDVLWAGAGGIALGAACGHGIGRLVLYLRHHHRLALGYDEFIALGLIAVTYSLALATLTYGFLAVFAAAYALGRHAETAQPGGDMVESSEKTKLIDAELEEPEPAPEEAAPDGAALTGNARSFNEQLERIGELLLVLLLGCLVWSADYRPAMALLVVLLLFVVRPLAVWAGLLGAQVPPLQRRLTGWFGIRGIGSVYYLAYAIVHDLPPTIAAVMVGTTLCVIATSIFLHGVTATPLMRAYGRRKQTAKSEGTPSPEGTPTSGAVPVPDGSTT